MSSKAQIVATIGPATKNKSILKKMIENGMDIARLNFSWGSYKDHEGYIRNIREAARETRRRVSIIQDLSGPRVQKKIGHEIKAGVQEIITRKDLADLKFGLEKGVDYVAMSYVGKAEDIFKLKEEMENFGKIIPVVAKIERKKAVQNIDEIIKAADAIMIARGDLGNEIPLEEIPFVEVEIIKKCKKANKPVIVATEMMLSMVENRRPSRAEATDVAFAIVAGADAVMLSEETARGKYPLETVQMMEKIISAAERRLPKKEFNLI